MLSNSLLSHLSFIYNLKALHLISRTFFNEKLVIINLMKTGTLTYAFHPSFQV